VYGRFMGERVSMATPIGRMAYAAGQAVRVGWYMGQYALAARLQNAKPPEGAPPGDTRAVLASLGALLRRDWENIRDGVYRMPSDLLPDPRRLLRDAKLFFEDLPEVAKRRQEGGRGALMDARAHPGLPRYYLQNFHFQTDGYLSDRSARLYDHQVEVLFGGGADAMRRQALVPIARHLRDRPVRGLKLLDVASGTGRLPVMVKENWPRLDVTALDLSAPYLAEARRRLSPWPLARVVQGAAEDIPAADASFDLVTCVYLLHELPPKVRAKAAAEMARVLKPGGLLVVVDSLVQGDDPAMDPLLELFPQAFHEPYYAGYIREDFRPLFEAQGLRAAEPDIAFMSRVVAFTKA